MLLGTYPIDNSKVVYDGSQDLTASRAAASRKRIVGKGLQGWLLSMKESHFGKRSVGAGEDEKVVANSNQGQQSGTSTWVGKVEKVEAGKRKKVNYH